MTERRYLIVIEGGDDADYSAYAPDLSGCVATGATLEERERAMRKAIAFHIEGLRQSGQPVPEPSGVTATYVEVAAYPAATPRRTRHRKVVSITSPPCWCGVLGPVAPFGEYTAVMRHGQELRVSSDFMRLHTARESQERPRSEGGCRFEPGEAEPHQNDRSLPGLILLTRKFRKKNPK